MGIPRIHELRLFAHYADRICRFKAPTNHVSIPIIVRRDKRREDPVISCFISASSGIIHGERLLALQHDSIEHLQLGNLRIYTGNLGGD